MKQYLHLIIASLFFVATVGGYTYWYHLMQQTREEVQSVASQATSKTREVAKVAQTKNALTSLSADEAAISAYFVATDDIVPFLSTIEKVGKTAGTNVQVQSVSEDVSAAPHGRLNLAVTIQGSFDAVMRTIGMIEYGPYDSRLVNVTLNSQGTSNASSTAAVWNVTATFSIGTQAPSGKPVAKPVTSATTTAATSSPASLKVGTTTAKTP
jgi:Tfp pilus assembly protein PilO